MKGIGYRQFFIFTVAFCLLLLCITSRQANAQQVRIMPLGNSITYDNHSNDTRTTGQRISYRYKLYQLLNQEGVSFDFVGNRDAGNDFFNDTDYDDVAGFPGITDDQMETLINSGINPRDGINEAPGPYLTYYPCDIILLHIGTNGLTESAADVQNLLSAIRFYAPNVIILVAEIINRRTYHLATTTFNNNVKNYVNSLGDSKMIMVDMEDGATINYATDMYDDLHPKQSGYDKMGQKWFSAIMAINAPPVISSIPKQIAIEGGSFADFDLKQYATDPNQLSSTLTDWTYQDTSTPEITVTLSNGVVSAQINDPLWSGSDTIMFKVTDNGNGAFKKSDSVYVVFEVTATNDPPVATALTKETIWEDAVSTFTVADFDVTDQDNDLSDISVILLPGTNYEVLSGNQLLPDANFTGNLTFSVQFADLLDNSDVYQFTVEVLNINDPPVINGQNSNQEVKEGESVTITKSVLQIADLDNDLTSLELFILDGEAYTVDNNTVTMNQGTAGNQSIAIRLFDGTDSSSVFNYQVLVISSEKPPAFISSPDTTVYEYGEYVYVFEATDPNGDALSYSLSRSPDWIEADLSQNKIVGSPGKDDLGTHLVEIEVTDGIFTIFQLFYVTVLDVNESPYFTSEPPTRADDYVIYSYYLSAEDPDVNDSLVFFTVEIPNWLVFNDSLNRLVGYPRWEHADDVFSVTLGVTDGEDTTLQSFSIFVTNDNSKPSIRSYPDTASWVDSVYVYELEFFDIDEDDDVSVIIYDKPGWLSYDANQFTFMGIPEPEDAGQNRLTIGLNDGRTLISESFTINVTLITSDNSLLYSDNENIQLFPVPVADYLTVNTTNPTYEAAIFRLFALNGTLLKQQNISLPGEVWLGDISPGIYFCEIKTDSFRSKRKIIIK